MRFLVYLLLFVLAVGVAIVGFGIAVVFIMGMFEIASEVP